MGRRRFHPRFADDLSSATARYDTISADLGHRFRAVVRARLEQITERPELFACVHAQVRAAMVRRFPYVILYQTRGDVVLMLGIHHAASDRTGWFHRAPQ